MLVHGVWLFALGNAFWRFDTYPARYYVSKLTNCKNLSKIGWLQIPFAEALKFVFDSLNCNTPLLHYFTETVRNCASNPPLSFPPLPPSFCLNVTSGVTSFILGKGRGGPCASLPWYQSSIMYIVSQRVTAMKNFTFPTVSVTLWA